jgi:predicted ATPase
MSRLDRLVSAKDIAQLGATIGRQFSYELLQAVSQRDEATLERELSRLVEAELVYQLGFSPQATYVFKHALVQDTAYHSLLRKTRQQYHQRIAQTLEARFPETVETQPELLAYHFTEGGCLEEAIGYWQRAGQRESDRSSYQEAMSHFTAGLTLLRTLPGTLARHQLELPLQTRLGAASLSVRGQGAPEVEAAYRRARVLCQQLGDTQDVFPVLFGLWRFYVVRPDFSLARQLGEELLALAKRRDETPLYVMAHLALGGTSLFLGELLPARRHLEEGIMRYSPAQRHSPLFRAGLDPGVSCHVFATLTLWLLGYPNQAVVRAHEALALATEIAHPFSHAYALFFAAVVWLCRREGQEVYDHAEAAMTLSTEQGFPLWLANSTIHRGWAMMASGQREEGLRQMRQGLTDYRATGAELGVPHFLALLADGYRTLKQVDEGLNALDEGMEVMERTNERWWHAEAHRLKGELLLQQGTPDVAQAESCFLQALTIARDQQAKSLELRAATSLARLWQSQDKRQDATDLLAPVYEWFLEGFETLDIQEAKALLEKLSA